PGCDDMGTVAHPHQDRPDLESVGYGLEEVARRAGGVTVGVDEDVGPAMEPPVRIQTLAQLGIESGVAVHLALVFEINSLGVEDVDRLARDTTGVVVEIAELGARADRDLRIDAEP